MSTPPPEISLIEIFCENEHRRLQSTMSQIRGSGQLRFLSHPPYAKSYATPAESANCFSWGRTTDQTIEICRNVIS